MDWHAAIDGDGDILSISTVVPLVQRAVWVDTSIFDDETAEEHAFAQGPEEALGFFMQAPGNYFAIMDAPAAAAPVIAAAAAVDNPILFITAFPKGADFAKVVDRKCVLCYTELEQDGAMMTYNCACGAVACVDCGRSWVHGPAKSDKCWVCRSGDMLMEKIPGAYGAIVLCGNDDDESDGVSYGGASQEEEYEEAESEHDYDEDYEPEGDEDADMQGGGDSEATEDDV